MRNQRRYFESENGTRWLVEVRAPTSSSAMVVFRHPDGSTSRLDRYNWHQWNGPEAIAVLETLDPRTVLSSLSDDDLKALFRRSMPVHTQQPRFNLIETDRR